MHLSGYMENYRSFDTAYFTYFPNLLTSSRVFNLFFLLLISKAVEGNGDHQFILQRRNVITLLIFRCILTFDDRCAIDANRVVEGQALVDTNWVWSLFSRRLSWYSVQNPKCVGTFAIMKNDVFAWNFQTELQRFWAYNDRHTLSPFGKMPSHDAIL